MKIKSSPELLAFYRWWFENKDKLGLLKCVGLCYLAGGKYPRGSPKLEIELITQFEAAGLNRDYPFSPANYDDRRFRETMHLDPLRIAWVEARIADMED